MPDSFKHDVPLTGMGQATFEQCWYASYRMMMKALNRSEGEVEAKLRPVINFDEAKAEGLLDTDFKKSADAMGFTAWPGSAFNREPGFFDIGLSDGAEAFLKELRLGPLWVSRRSGPNSYHIVVAVGYNDDGDGKIIFNNPFPGPRNAIEVQLKANLFVRNITGATGSVQAKR